MIDSLYLVFHAWLIVGLASGTLTVLATLIAKEVAKREK